MQGGEKLSLEQIRALMQASQEVRFAGHGRAEVYAWILLFADHGAILPFHQRVVRGAVRPGLGEFDQQLVQ